MAAPVLRCQEHSAVWRPKRQLLVQREVEMSLRRRVRWMAIGVAGILMGSLGTWTAASASPLTTSPRASAPVVPTTSPPSIDWALASKPRGVLPRTDKLPPAGPRHTASRGSSTNLSCSGCNPLLLFNQLGQANVQVTGSAENAPGRVTIVPVYWAPNGYRFPQGYQSVIGGYLQNVAADSGHNSNAFGVADEYYQGNGQHIQYSVGTGSEVDTTDPYPSDTGSDGCVPDPGVSYCIADGQLQAEVAHVIMANNLPSDDAHLYMVFFPPSVETCQGTGAASSTNECSTNTYCGYHSAFPTADGRPEIYANEPYPNLNGCGDPWDGPQSPNGNAPADAEISIVSHEANEAITDWDGAWYDSSGNENGDECAYTYGFPVGGNTANGTAFNQVINGAHYFTQDEFSNVDYSSGIGDPQSGPNANFNGHVSTGNDPTVKGCVQRATPATGQAAPYHPLSPYRVCDTRSAAVSGVTDACTGATLGANGNPGTLTLQVTGTNPSGNGSAGIPASGVTAVVLNVTAVHPTSAGYLTLYPTGTPQPLAANLNFTPGAVVPNLVTVAVPASGKVSIFEPFGSVDVVVDVQGYYAPSTDTAGLYNPVSPYRVCDTRTLAQSGITDVCTGSRLGAQGRSETLGLQVTGTNPGGTSSGGIPPSGVSAVVLNVTAVAPSDAGYLTVWPTGTAQPLAANLNFAAGEVVPNRIIVPVGTNGEVNFFNSTGTNDIVVDVTGWYTDSTISTGYRFTPTSPVRLCDTRPVSVSSIAVSCSGHTLGASGASSETLKLQAAGYVGIPYGGVPSNAKAVLVNLTAVSPTQAGYLTVYPDGATLPLAADLNFIAGETVPNLVIATLGSDGAIDIFNSGTGTNDVVADVGGWFS